MVKLYDSNVKKKKKCQKRLKKINFHILFLILWVWILLYFQESGVGSTSKHGNEAAKSHYYLQIAFYRVCKHFSSSGLSPIQGVFLHTHKDRDNCVQHRLYFSAADRVLCDFPDHTFRGVISSLTCLWVQWTAKTFLFTEQFLFWCDKAARTVEGEGKSELFPWMRTT